MNCQSMTRAAAVVAAAVFLTLGLPGPSRVQMLPHTRAQRDLPPALQQSLEDKVSDEAGPYLDKEDEKKAQGKIYTDLQQKFEYLPNYNSRPLVVSVKLGGAEYDPTKKTTVHGAPTGNLRYLVFTYARENNKWVEIAKPKWESQNLGAAGRAEMTNNMQRAEKREAATQKSARVHAAAAAAAAAAQKAAGGGS